MAPVTTAHRGGFTRLIRPLITILLLAITGCGAGGPTGEAPLLVFAASDLQPVLPEIAAAFESGGGRPVQLVFGSSGSLATQIENGAPASLYLAANERFVDRLIERDRIEPGSRRAYARGRLALVAAPGVTVPRSLEELTDPRFRVIAIANPEHAPYGEAARGALETAGLWPLVEERLILADNVAQAFQLVRSGSADAGIVASALALSRAPGESVPIPDTLHRPLLQTGGVVRGAAHAGEATAFLSFLSSDPRARAILRTHGFELPEEG